MKKLAILIVVIAFLIGCASVEKKFTGQPLSKFIEVYGEPQHIEDTELGGKDAKLILHTLKVDLPITEETVEIITEGGPETLLKLIRVHLFAAVVKDGIIMVADDRWCSMAEVEKVGIIMGIEIAKKLAEQSLQPQ